MWRGWTGSSEGSRSVADVVSRRGRGPGQQTKLGSVPPGAINYNLIEGRRGDPADSERTEVVIEEGVLSFPLSPFPARELRRLQQYWSWRGAVATVA